MRKLKKQIRMRENAIRKRSKQTQFGRDPSLPKKTVDVGNGAKKRTIDVPTFDTRGKAVQPEKKRRQKRILISGVLTTGLLGFVYLPQFLPVEMHSRDNAELTVKIDHEAVRNSNVCLRDNPQEDFDEDGILNADETSLGTDPWSSDTDDDGVTDYAELYITKTSPTEKTGVLEDMQMKLDKAEGKTLAHPYRIGNVILWPDTYQSKAYGSVVETENSGYCFCGFSGSVLFPEKEDQYAYRVEKGVHTLLKNDPSDHTWEVADGDHVVLYEERLKEYTKLGLFGCHKAWENNRFLSVIDAILPEKGFLTSRKVTEPDIQNQVTEPLENEIKKPFINENDSTRLKYNMDSLAVLGKVRASIRSGKCVAVSLFSSTKGEYLGILYGLTDAGDFLVADMDTREKAGEIHVIERAGKLLNEEGEIISRLTFAFDGLGFSSDAKDRISFFAYSN